MRDGPSFQCQGEERRGHRARRPTTRQHERTRQYFLPVLGLAALPQVTVASGSSSGFSFFGNIYKNLVGQKVSYVVNPNGTTTCWNHKAAINVSQNVSWLYGVWPGGCLHHYSAGDASETLCKTLCQYDIYCAMWQYDANVSGQCLRNAAYNQLNCSQPTNISAGQLIVHGHITSTANTNPVTGLLDLGALSGNEADCRNICYADETCEHWFWDGNCHVERKPTWTASSTTANLTSLVQSVQGETVSRDCSNVETPLIKTKFAWIVITVFMSVSGIINCIGAVICCWKAPSRARTVKVFDLNPRYLEDESFQTKEAKDSREPIKSVSVASVKIATRDEEESDSDESETPSDIFVDLGPWMIDVEEIRSQKAMVRSFQAGAPFLSSA